MVDFKIKAGDTLPHIEAVLQNGSLVNAVQVRFQMRIKARRGMAQHKPIKGEAVIDDRTANRVHYEWLALDTLHPGLYEAEWQVTYADGSVLTFPNDDYNTVEITPQVA
jgi:hypothetical protein